MRVAVLQGGRSLEAQVSRQTAQRVEESLRRGGHETHRVEADADLVRTLDRLRPDVAFLALHGPDGEDGTLQELLEVLGIPYTGSGPAASERCSDKVVAKRILADAGLPTPEAISVSAAALKRLGAGDALERAGRRLGFPLVVKPGNQGSGLGLRTVADAGALPDALVAALSYGDRALLERRVDGDDIAVSVLTGAPGRPGTEVGALPPVAIHPKDQDAYAARYTIGRTDFTCPADLDGDLDEQARTLAVAAFRALGGEGYGRVDLMLDRATGGLTVLEVETLPGLTHTSYLPVAAEAAGISFDALVTHLVTAGRDDGAR